MARRQVATSWRRQVGPDAGDGSSVSPPGTPRTRSLSAMTRSDLPRRTALIFVTYVVKGW
ncbi:hypothetical protein [Actinophytocola sp.]|uniref:hypothetical protein n=1 Tax=Actinophytocola sp. TaxID=1872138 RepID=UPI003D6A3608